MRDRLQATIWIGLCALTLLASPAPGRAAGLRAGAFAQDITPTRYPVSVNGGFVDRQISAASDPLHARCLVLDDGKTTLALVVVDSCMVPREVIDLVRGGMEKRTGIPAGHLLISATHTHSAPTLGSVFGSSPNAEYTRELPNRIVDGIERAQKNLRPARLGTARVRYPEALFNRRWKREKGLIPPDPFGNTTDQVQMNPGHRVPGLLEQAGGTDPEVSILSVQTRDGAPLAAYVCYSLHYVGGVEQLSADYFGMFCDRMAQKLRAPQDAPPFMAALANGTSGDVNNVNFAQPAQPRKTGEQARLVAEALAEKVLAALPGIDYRSDLTFAVKETELKLKVRKGTPAELERARGILEAVKGKPPSGVSSEVYARETLALAEYPDTVPVRLQAMRIGSQAVAAIPCEVFTEIGLEIKQKSAIKPVFTVSLANGYNGYLPTPAQHALGGYETWRARSSYLEVDASVKITRSILELLEAVK